ncbi:hypothetical protein KC19_N025600 [Ceratodon purpureus]|nr:hypothetical protein KC19_N025600 [Ceratodon purpureus]
MVMSMMMMMGDAQVLIVAVLLNKLARQSSPSSQLFPQSTNLLLSCSTGLAVLVHRARILIRPRHASVVARNRGQVPAHRDLVHGFDVLIPQLPKYVNWIQRRRCHSLGLMNLRCRRDLGGTRTVARRLAGRGGTVVRDRRTHVILQHWLQHRSRPLVPHRNANLSLRINNPPLPVCASVLKLDQPLTNQLTPRSVQYNTHISTPTTH